IATLENQRVEPVLAALSAGYHLLVEKPLATNLSDTLHICDAATRSDSIFIVCHQMRHSPRLHTLKRLVSSGRFGEIVNVQHSENLSFSHMAHSYVRGFFNNDALSPMLLAKSCHDMDYLRFLVDAPPRRIASFGSLQYFRPENAPPGATQRCLDGCPAYRECPYHVLKLYFEDQTDPAYLRQMGVVRGKHHLLALLRTNRFGRCVFHHDNNVVDNQVVQIEFKNGVTASFTMCGHNMLERRMTKVSLCNGEIEVDSTRAELRVHSFSPLESGTVRPHGIDGTHGGGDRVIMDSFVDAVISGDRRHILTPVRESLDGHLMVFAAEASRRTGQIVEIEKFENDARKHLTGF
ncbi:MAG: Gfo/Idh/MocA family oxidoreductase, partial [Lentisphaerae bacterium]|nr:Gfo/Idh/MocA family oxidoreductase [Lentisphaerota bacterium]